MAKAKSQSVRERRAQHQARRKQQRLVIIGVGVAGVVLIAVLMWWTRQVNTVDEELVLPPTLEEPATADGMVWGPEDAPVLIEEFSDFQCPYCGQHARENVPQLLAKYASSGLVRYEFNPYAFLGAESIRAAEAAYCANEQGAFWQYHDMLYYNQHGENRGAFRDEVLRTFAAALNLDQAAFDTCLNSDKYEDQVRADLDAAKAREVGTTPSFIINGELVVGAMPFADFDLRITNALSGQ
ncbi:MAG: DsbA family protein [Anaerolineales bacterium]|nr:DsbA family protein [Anaerolineales bacterium]MCB8968914.1 DsbA family protein [Ardenticatenaceae bacterium]